MDVELEEAWEKGSGFGTIYIGYWVLMSNNKSHMLFLKESNKGIIIFLFIVDYL